MKQQITDRVTLAYDAAFTHFYEIINNHRDESMAIKSFWVIGPMTFMPHIEKGQGGAITCNSIGGT